MSNTFSKKIEKAIFAIRSVIKGRANSREPFGNVEIPTRAFHPERRISEMTNGVWGIVKSLNG
jgi:hypothetical protein